ncbi:HutD family protein [Paragemmobacter straminiformis]|uniref:HutD family protein n=1 Tax=Paragemmobacter straminiformis TaxID=2045119 RepID=A0A842I8L8_9RHOB|nr:HutD family protein [Gemmobacter straminiformis]MBC2836180.1 HutD family protein [Gemmobacter straminiformis]
MRVLRAGDYRQMPWANGKGVTVELAKAEKGGALLWRLSMATVAEDGPFSVFPAIERNLTVLDGPGFRLVGAGVDLDCLPLRPVAFAGDVPVRATGTGGQVSTDFNVMTARHLPKPQAWLPQGAVAAGGLLAFFALGAAQVGGVALARHDLALTEGAADVAGAVLAVRLFV